MLRAGRRLLRPADGIHAQFSVSYHICPPHARGFCTRRAGKFGAGGCRGRCRSQPFATKERYGCGSAACRYTSARGAVAHSPEISVKSVHAAWADVGIGPYKRIWGYIRIRRGIFVFGGAGCGGGRRRGGWGFPEGGGEARVCLQGKGSKRFQCHDSGKGGFRPLAFVPMIAYTTRIFKPCGRFFAKK